MGVVDFFFRVAQYGVNSARDSRRARNIRAENDRNRGVNELRHPVECFICGDTDRNVIISGNNDIIRNRTCCASAYNSYKNGHGAVILHCGNKALEANLRTAFQNDLDRLTIINSDNPGYDPFLDLTSDGIAQMVINSNSDKYNTIGTRGRSYIVAASEFLNYKGRRRLVPTFIECPYDILGDLVQDNIERGEIPRDHGNLLLNQIRDGDFEHNSIRQYFNTLKNQAQLILADYERPEKDTISIRKALQSRSVICIDVVSSANILLLNLLVEEMNMAINSGTVFSLVIDSIPYSASERLEQMICNTVGSYHYTLSSQDIVSSSANSDTLFSSIIGRSDTMIIMQHHSGQTAEKFSKFFGTYERREEDETRTSGLNFERDLLVPGINRSRVVTYRNVDKPRVSVNEIMNLRPDEMLVKIKDGGFAILQVRCTNGDLARIRESSLPRRS